MVLQVSGQISTADIQSEFAQVGEFNIFDYYRGGAIVADIAENSGVPTSGQISLNDFYGAALSAVIVPDLVWGDQPDRTIYAIDNTLAKASANLLFDGSVSIEGAGSLSNWMDDIDAIHGDNYEARFIQISGSAVSGNTVFTPIAIDPSFSLSSSSGIETAVIDVEIQENGNPASVEVVRITLTAEQSNV